MKVLLIEDDHLVGKLIAQQLKFQNFEVVIAFDGASAVELFLEHKVDIIISDLLLPKMSGFSSIKAIQHVDMHNTPLIVISSLNDIPVMLKNAELRYDAYIQKPFSAQQLIEKIHKVIDLHMLVKS
jgi:DNA-binding response OmpR family regulator